MKNEILANKKPSHFERVNIILKGCSLQING